MLSLLRQSFTKPATIATFNHSGRRVFATLLGAPVPLPANTPTALGFEATGVRCGIKKKRQTTRTRASEEADVFDFCLIRSREPCAAAAVFTLNQFCAAPVLASKEVLSTHSNEVGGVAINAGCANACTGEQGLKDAKTMVALGGSIANTPNSLVMSTGVIGPFLPMAKIEDGFKKAVASFQSQKNQVEGWANAAKAIMTTDTQPKCIHRSLSIDGKSYTMSGICKGAGMIHPNMATLLGIVATDISISPACLKQALTFAVDRSFNSISIDGDTSTNDTIAVLANGLAPAWKQASNKTYAITSTSSSQYLEFQSHLTRFCTDLSQMIVQDGEGVTKFVEVRVSGGRNYNECKIIANSIARSPLVKTAFFGQDANWGRILCAVGYAGVPIETNKVNLYIRPAEKQIIPPGQTAPPTPAEPLGTLHIVKSGQPFDCNEAHATALFKQSSIVLNIDLGLGDAEATVWTCDLSIDYVKINADYRS